MGDDYHASAILGELKAGVQVIIRLVDMSRSDGDAPHAVSVAAVVADSTRLTPLTKADLLQQKMHAEDIYQSIQSSLHKMVVGGAAASLVLSTTFLEKIAPHPREGSRVFLATAWIALVLSLAFSLWALSTAASAHFVDVNALADLATTGHDADSDRDTSNSSIAIRDRCARALLVIGVAALAIFAYRNVTFVP